jgi:hypothetical protein
MTLRKRPQTLHESDKKILENVEEFGWHVVVIRETDKRPGWAFSIGLYEQFNHPEVIVFGLPRDLIQNVINSVGEDVRSGKSYESGRAYSGILDGVLCMFQAVEKCWYEPLLGYARWFYQGDDFPVLQCIWPDKKQNYPWDPSFRRDWIWAQPLLFHTDAAKANADEVLRSINESKHEHSPSYTQKPAGHDSSDSLQPTARSARSHHRFTPAEWPFADPENTEAFTTTRVIEENYPILLVTHDEDGAWQILCGTTNDPEHARAVCLGCLYERDKTIGQLADLPRGWRARRESPDAQWHRLPLPAGRR